MATKPLILVVDDKADFLDAVAERLKYLDYPVLKAHNGFEGLEMAKQQRPDLIILDVMMPKMDGFEVCRRLKAHPETEHILILMLTARDQLPDKVKGFGIGADDYLVKASFEMAELVARVEALLRRRPAFPPFNEIQNNCIFSILCRPDRRIHLRGSGSVSFNATSQGELKLNSDEYARQGENVPRLDWRFNSKHWGKQLYQQIFVDHPKILGNYNQALGVVGDEEKLHFRFEASRDFLRVPLEFLFDDVDEGRNYLVLRHPIARLVTDVKVRRETLSPKFFNDLWHKHDVLRILLIASNTIPSIPGVEQEIEALDSSLKALFEYRGIAVEVDTIPTEQATYEVVREALRKCKYHILHYAGHGNYDNHSPEMSHLTFWEKERRQGSIRDMAIAELQMLLRGSDLRFAYLSCCLGTTTGEPAKLLDDDFLGIADGIVQAGVPSVLGFRWPVDDDGAKNLALTFYKSLANQGELDTALLDARCEVAGRDRDDLTWLSPILIMQG